MKLKIVSPILGFESVKEVHFSPIDDFFSRIENEPISFTLIRPERLRQYAFEIPLFYKDLLQAQSDEDLEVYTIITVYKPIEKSTVNFAAPVLINPKKGLLAQVMLDDTKYPEYGIREPIENYLGKED
ncbi:MAG: hypothetical protein B6D59_06595 [Campylobacteraceae bacterium 4484_4]|nr:MAG: hypothetical protein B6D59_06595 [Campylobacteraceae bacterium 4484_4]